MHGGKWSITINNLDFLILIYFLFLVCNIFFTRNGIYWDVFFLTVSFFSVYFLIKFFGRHNINLIERCFLLGSTLFCLIQFYFLLSQSNTEKFNFKGSFENSGPLGIWLSIVFPVFAQKLKHIFFALLSAAVLYLIIITGSRLSLFITICTFILINRKYLIKIKWYYTLGLFLGILSILYLILMRSDKGTDSFKGRTMIWKVVSTIDKNPLWGNGINGVYRDFGHYNAAFFSKRPTDDSILLTAKIDYAFNDFLQIFVEQGIVGLFIFIAILFIALSIKETTEIKYKYSLYALVVGCLASYPLEVPEILFTVMVITAVISLNKPGRIINMGKGIFIYLFFFTSVTILCLFKLFNTHQARNNVKTADKFIEKKQYNSAVSIFKKNFSALYFDYDFLTAYAKTLFHAENYTQSLLIINMAKKYSCEPYLYITEGDNFMKLGLSSKAEDAYNIAAKMYPSLMYPKYKLAKFYYATENIRMAKSVAEGIMKMKIKIPSPAVQEMRAGMLEILAH